MTKPTWTDAGGSTSPSPSPSTSPRVNIATSVDMSAAKLDCSSTIDPELSTTNRRSTSRRSGGGAPASATTLASEHPTARAAVSKGTQAALTWPP